MELFSSVFTLLIFALLGFYSKIGVKIPAKIISIAILVFSLVAVSFIGINTKLFSVKNFSLMLNNILQGFVLGILINVLLKIIKTKAA